MSDTLRFFARLFAPDTLGTVVLFALPGAHSVHVPPEPEKILYEAGQLADRNVYFGVLPRRPGTQKKGGNDDLLDGAVLWLDLDIGTEGHASSACPPDVASAAALIPESGLPDPSAVVFTGGGLHLYWWLSHKETPRKLSEATRALQERVQTTAAAKGWHVDLTHSADRILRVPGTQNWKGAYPRPCALIDFSDREYTLHELTSPTGPASSFASSRPPSPVLPPGIGPSSPPHDDAGPVGEVNFLPPADARNKIREQMRRLGSSTYELGRLLLDGRPLQKGSRDIELTRAASLVAALAANLVPNAEDVVEILYPTVDATLAEEDDLKNPAPTRQNALNKLRRQLANFRKKKAQEKESADGLVKAYRRAARASAQVHEALKEEELPDGPYSADELRSFEVEHGTPLQWIVQLEGAHYVLVNGQYKGPVVMSDLAVFFKEALSPAPLSLVVYENNKAREMKVPEILEKHATRAERIVADLRLPTGRWDREEKTFFEACARRRKIFPAHNPEIHRWLELLGGKHADKLLDWIASVTRLDHYCAALYLSKTPGTGKSLLAHGLAKIWADSPTDLSKVVGAWNTDIARCPLIVADEHLPATWGRSGEASGELRNLVGTDSRMLTRKYLPNVELKGAVRVMLLSNNKSMLPQLESLGPEDIAAIGSRFLHIATQPDAAEYLASLGGKRGKTRNWVDGDQIAAHALWLKENRQVVGDGRFLVEGDPNEIRLRLITGTKIGGLVCEVIVRTLMAPPKGPQAVRAGGGRLLVSTSGVSEQWEFCVKSDRVESTQRIGRQLSAMSDGSIKVAGHPHHSVRPEYIYYWIEQNLVGDVEKIKAMIENNPPTLELVGGKA